MTTQTTNGRGDSAAQYKDGQTIPLPRGWSLYLSTNWDSDTPHLQGFVHSPKGENQDSASLCAARDLGITTGVWGDEIKIPADVMSAINDEKFDAFA